MTRHYTALLADMLKERREKRRKPRIGDTETITPIKRTRERLRELSKHHANRNTDN